MSRFYGTRQNGRKPGTPNKATAKTRETFSALLENNLDRLQKDIDQLEPKDRIKAILELANFVLPKLKAVEYTDIPPTDENDYFQPVIINFDK